MDALLQDLKFAARTLWKDRGFALAAGGTLALCIAANAAIFGVVDAVVLTALPFPESDRLVTMWNAYPGAGLVGRGANGAVDFVERRALTDVFAELAAYQDTGVAMDLGGTPQRVRAMRATPGLFPLLGATATAGRTFREEEGDMGRHRVVVLSEQLATEMFGGASEAPGRSLLLDGETHQVVGVMPAGWTFLDDSVRLWVPLPFSEGQLQAYHSNNYSMVARLQPGVALEQVQAQIDALNARNMERMPELAPLLENAGFHTPVSFLEDDLVRDVRGNLYLLWGGAAFVLLIGCLNVANLVLVRSTARARELATRFALGARHSRVARQLLTEIMLLTMVAAAVGVALGGVGLHAAADLLADQLPRAYEIGLDVSVVGFALALALVVGAAVTLIPLAGITRGDLSAVFREEGRSGTAGPGVRLARKGMVVAQVAMALLLLVGAALLLASFQQLLGVDLGFDPEGLLTARVAPPDVRYGDTEREIELIETLVSNLEALPEVESAAAVNQIPLGGGASDSVIFAEGYVPPEGESPVSPLQYRVTPGYFRTLGVELLAGRLFDDRDGPDGEPVMVIDQQLARRFWPGGGAVGQRMWRPNDLENLSDPASADHFRVIGVVESVTHRGIAAGGDEVGAYYFPLGQARFPWGAYHLALRTEGRPESLVVPLRRSVSEVDGQLPVYDVRTMHQRVTDSLADRRSPLALSLAFGVVALVLAAVGIYGVLAHLVSLRTREMGIRIALGCDRAGVFRLVLREGALMVTTGLGLGLLGSWAVGRALASRLYGVGALDPLVLGGVTALLCAVGFFACAVPARRATRIDPVDALTDA